MATVTREQKAIEAWAKAMATAENYAVDPHQHIARLVEAGEQMAALLAPKDAAALASPPAEDELQRHDCEAWAMEGIGCAHCNPVALAIRAAQAPPASDPPGPTVINEDDGDVTIDFDYANDRVVSIRLGEESSGLSAFVDGESHALCPLDRVPPKVLALLRTEAKAVTLRQSDPPRLVALVDKHIDGLRRVYSLDGMGAAMREMGKIRIEALEGFRDTLRPASPQAKED